MLLQPGALRVKEVVKGVITTFRYVRTEAHRRGGWRRRWPGRAFNQIARSVGVFPWCDGFLDLLEHMPQAAAIWDKAV